MSRSAILTVAVVLLAAAFALPGPARAHDFPAESALNAFVKVEAERLHLVVRVPLHLLGARTFPANVRSEIELEQAGPAIEGVLAWLAGEIRLREDGALLAPAEATGRLSLPSDRSFERYETALAHVAQPADPGTAIYVEQGYLDAHFSYAIRSPRSHFTIQTTLLPQLRDSLRLFVRFEPLDGPARAYQITSSSGEVPLDPRWYEAALAFVRLGFVHILGGVDHLLFLLCLAVPFQRLGRLLPVLTAFTAAHSATLIASALGAAPGGEWFPPLVETLIAASIVYMALENVVGADLGRRWLLSAAFGLVHGFGFAYGLRESLQFAGDHLLLSLLAFNLGIEVGQVAVLLVALPALRLALGRLLVGRVGVIALSAVLAHTGWHWMLERAERLQQVEWPTPDAAAVALAARWALALLLAGGAAWAIGRRLARRPAGRPSAESGG